MQKILVVNGPNLNLLGTREPEIYGTSTLDDVIAGMSTHAFQYNLGIIAKQSNHEGAIVDYLQEIYGRADYCGIIINAGAYTHTSIAIADALKLFKDMPIIEVHITDPHKREEYRKVSYTSEAAQEVIKGKGIQGYLLAIDAINQSLSR